MAPTTVKTWKPSGYRAVRTGTSSDFLNWGEDADLTYQDSPNEHLYTNQVKPYFRAPQILRAFHKWEECPAQPLRSLRLCVMPCCGAVS